MLGKFGNVLLCEDVRVEINNKHTLVGVLSGDINFGEVPGSLQAAFYIEYTPLRKGEVLNVRVLLDDGVIAAGVIDVPQLAPGSASIIVLPKGVIAISQDCDLKVQFNVDDGEWETILKRRLQKGMVPSIVAPPPT
jgi:hypothetical protein